MDPINGYNLSKEYPFWYLISDLVLIIFLLEKLILWMSKTYSYRNSNDVIKNVT